MAKRSINKVIDLFAGPGGLGEGFSSAGFEVVLSCEMERNACDTLILRKFFHMFNVREVPEEYYELVRSKDEKEFEKKFKSLKSLYPNQYREALRRVMRVQLNHEDEKRRPFFRKRVHSRIKRALESSGTVDDFVLVGGPPCQAYSLAGRSRRKGLGKEHTLDKNNQRLAEGELPVELRQKKEAKAKEFYSDPKHKLYLEYLEIIAVHRPVVFVMENVQGITSARSAHDDDKAGSIFKKIISDLRSPGEAVYEDLPLDLKEKYGFQNDLKYRLVSMSKSEITDLFGDPVKKTGDDFLVGSENYGVPQARSRVFIVGIREDLEGRPPVLRSLNKKVTVRQMIGDMPKLRSGLSKGEDSSESWYRAIKREYDRLLKGRVNKGLSLASIISEIHKLSETLTRGGLFVECEYGSDSCVSDAPEVLQWVMDRRLKGYIRHDTRSHMASDLARYLFCSAYAQNSNQNRSPKLEEWPNLDLLPDHKNVKGNIDTNGELKISVGSNSDRFRVQVWDSPSKTVVSHISKDGHAFIHPDPVQCRSLTVREAARLQTFPDNYFFSGGRTAQYEQVGNAVPPYLAKQIAASIMKFLE